MIAEDKYIKLKVNGLLDLEKLSIEYQIPKNELIAFHNNYCEISELLPLNLPKYVPFIYIPKNNFESRNVKLIQSNTLKYPINKSQKEYGVVLTYLHSDTKIHYEVITNREDSAVEIHKKKSFVNNKEVEKIIEKLYEKVAGAIYPLKVSVNSNGGFSKIENEKEIAERWKRDISPELKEYYVGKTAEEILAKLDRTFENLNSKKDFLSRSIFHQLYFLPVFQTYSGYTKSGVLNLYFAKIQKYISYDIRYFLSKEYTRGTKIALQITGKEQNDPSHNNGEPGNVDLLYKFHKDTNELFSIAGTVSTFNKGKELKIEFEMFEI
ncbi:hypothetical protein LUD75_18935 [Epilithonimonas sp. JDS]|uniref:hypothetical protein n=1 Tax=Epilithonimonas sp. JDS TaxID=2902797 RepID=UPI001E4C440C|nr:hypothetical protein [Epilithonimonas sp. JDS]MCD9856807.1 hypothetical protein [Epilithonimonas sp. JDS]